jgi:acyl-CoA synthetase (AMP-forming)/AMP-acid ligase II
MPNCPEYAIAFHAAATAGGRVTTSNPLYKPGELAHQFKDAHTKIVVTVPPFKDIVQAAAEEAGCVKQVCVMGEDSGKWLFADRGVRAESLPAIDPESCIALPYSSGTTGLPKGTMLSHRNLVANVQQVVSNPHHNLEMSSADTVLGLLPFFHIYGMIVIMAAALRVGATVVTMPKFEPEPFLTTLQQHKVTWGPLVPPLALFLAKHPVVDKFDLSHLRVIFSGAAPLDAATQRAVQARLPGVSVRQGYGMTELSPVSHFTDPKNVEAGSVGFLAPGCEAKIIDPETGAEMGYGEEGELCVRGPNVMMGYLNNETATTATIFPDGFLRTGDIAVVREDGHTFIRERLKELIKVKGFQVAPAELEGLILSCPGVADVAVIGVSDDRDGEHPKAFVVRAGSETGKKLTEEDIKSFVQTRVADYKKLGAVEFIAEVPKSASGKILRRLLKLQHPK